MICPRCNGESDECRHCDRTGFVCSDCEGTGHYFRSRLQDTCDRCGGTGRP